MSDRGAEADRAAALRRAFDTGFAAAPRPPDPPQLDLLRIRLGSAAYVVAAADLAAVHAGLTVVPLPTPAPELLGVATVRGVVIPIYDLARLIGLAPAAAARWIVEVGALGLAFDGFDGQLRVAAAAVTAEGARPGRFVRGFVHHDDATLGVIDLAAVIAAIRERWSKEP